MTLVAIDFGTSNTVVCTLDPVTQKPRTIKFDHIGRSFIPSKTSKNTEEPISIVPSLVYIQEAERFILGEQVRSQRLGFTKPDRLFQSFKRDLAANFRPPNRIIDQVSYDAELIAEIFLTEIFAQVRSQVNEISQVVFTVPVGAFELYLDWFRDLALRLELPNLQIIDESTAAALGYAVNQMGTVVLVVDFGGGTLDLSLVRTPKQNSHNLIRAEVLAKSDIYVGGVDIDTWIVEDRLRQLQTNRQEIGELGWLNLLEIAERLKIRLSEEENATESWFDDENFTSYQIDLDRDRFTEILEQNQLLEQLRQALDETLAIASNKGVGKNQIEQVLLVGGSCQIPAVQQLLISYFGRAKVKLDKPFEAVAQGALAIGQSVVVEDYLRHGYAIRLWEPYSRSYSYFPLFEKGSKYPCRSDQPLVLQVASDGQAEIRLDIGEIADISEAEVTYDRQGRMSSSQVQKQAKFRSLIDPRLVKPLSNSEVNNSVNNADNGSNPNNQVCLAHLDPPGKVGIDRIEIKFEVNSDRSLIATVMDLQTKQLLVDQGAIARLG
jgi:molecular chaperone DnaK (HSP70)